MSSNVYALAPPDAPKRSDIDAALSLVMSLADAKGTAATLKRLDAAVAAGAKAEDRVAEADRREAAADAREAGEKERIAKLWAVHEARVEASQRQHDEQLATRVKALEERERLADEAHKHNVSLHDDLERRLALVKQAST